MTTGGIVLGDNHHNRGPVAKIDRVWVGLGGDRDRGASFTFVLLEGEEVDAHLEFVVACRHLVVGDWELDLVETLFGEEALAPECALRIYCSRVDGRQHPISKAAVVGVLDFDDCLVLRDECG